MFDICGSFLVFWTMRLILAVLMIFSLGCASIADRKHQDNLRLLDEQYKSGQIDAVQYQAKYSEESQRYSSERLNKSMFLATR